MVAQSGAAFARPRFVLTLGRQAAAYLAVSVVALGIDTGLYLALAASGTTAWTAAGAGYLLGLIIHFLLSKTLVFAASRKSGLRLFVEFTCSGIAGLVLTMGVVEAMTNFAGFALLPAKIMAVVMSFAAVFVVRRSIVFAG